MSGSFFERPILNSPYEYPSRHWELDPQGQPTERILDQRRRVSFITPIPRPKKHRAGQRELIVGEEQLSSEKQQYDPTGIINEVRNNVDNWRRLASSQWQVSPETARLLQYWRHHAFETLRPFFCQVEAVETAIWLTEVAPHLAAGKCTLQHLQNASRDANPLLDRLALKLATGAGKTTVMAMLIAWQTINFVRRPGSKHFTKGFLIVTPGLTIKDRLRVLQPNDPDRRQSYDLNEDGLFDAEYADIFGIPFDFTAKPVVAPPRPPIDTVQVKAVRPERDHLEIRFPRVEGYRAELPEDRLTATFGADSVLELTPDLVGPSKTRNQGIIGESAEMNLEHLEDVRQTYWIPGVNHLGIVRALGVSGTDGRVGDGGRVREEGPWSG